MRPNCRMTMLVLTLLSSIQAAAQESNFKFELAPYAAYQMGGSFYEEDGDGRIAINDSNALGFIFDIDASPNTQYEFLYTRQRTDANTRGFLQDDPTIDMDVGYLQFGGTYLFDDNKTRPFIALTLGLTQFDPNLADTGSENFLSASFGGGVQINANGRLGLRLEARVFTTFIDGDSDIFCQSIDGAGSCLVRVDSRTLSQWQALAGIVFRF